MIITCEVTSRRALFSPQVSVVVSPLVGGHLLQAPQKLPPSWAPLPAHCEPLCRAGTVPCAWPVGAQETMGEWDFPGAEGALPGSPSHTQAPQPSQTWTRPVQCRARQRGQGLPRLLHLGAGSHLCLCSRSRPWRVSVCLVYPSTCLEHLFSSSTFRG